MKKGKKNLLIRKLLKILIKKTKLFKRLKKMKNKRSKKRKTKSNKKKLKSNTSLFIKHGWLEETFTFPSR